MATDWFQFPVISGLMVTGSPDRHDVAVLAVEDFVAQDWTNKELAIINATNLAFPKYPNVFEIPVRRASDVWEFGVNQCNGEWIADWQDDCRYDPAYLRILARKRRKDAIVRLHAYFGRMLDTGESVVVDNFETKFSLSFRFGTKVHDIVWRDNPELVTRYYAGKSTSG